MILCVDLRKPLRLRGRSFVALRAQHGRIWLYWNNGNIVCMLALRTMTCLAVNSGMFPSILFLEDIRMACLAGLMAGVNYGQGSNFGDGLAPVMTVLPETAWDEKGANAEKC
jgi:hypothetical protein